MNNQVRKRKYPVFSELKTPEELVTYLDDFDNRLKNAKYLYHYTELSTAIKIFKSHCWHLCMAKGMNDLVEYKCGDESRWNNIFFASFMADSKESIGMWSMYSQPWKDGVKISIPKKDVFAWVKNINEILEISLEDYQLTGRKVVVGKNAVIRLSCVSYSNSFSLESSDSDEVVTWSNKTNKHILKNDFPPILTGYVKDKAWDYEKEVRLKAEFENPYGFERVAVRIPDEIMNHMTITAGPLFEGNICNRIENEIGKKYNVDESLFKGKLNLKTY